nr:TrgA family protein [Aestuariivita boseongensis]
MPNAASLFAAVSLAVIAFIVSGQIMPLFPEGKDFGYFTFVNMAIGAAVGWKVMGTRAGRGFTPGINNGLTGVAVMVFWALFVQGCYEMFRLAMRNRYDGAFDAIMGIFEVSYDYAVTIAQPNIIATLLIGAVCAGLVTEYVSRKWR